MRRSREESLFEITAKLAGLTAGTDLQDALRLEFEAWLSQDLNILIEAIFAYLKAKQVVTARELHCFLYELEPGSGILGALSNFKYTRDDCAWIIRGKEAQYNHGLMSLLAANWTAIDSCVKTIDIVTPGLATFSSLTSDQQTGLLARITAPVYTSFADAFQKFRITYDTARLLMQVPEPSDRIINQATQKATDAMMIARQMPLVKPLKKTLFTHADVISKLAARTSNLELREEYLHQADRERTEATNLQVY